MKFEVRSEKYERRSKNSRGALPLLRSSFELRTSHFSLCARLLPSRVACRPVNELLELLSRLEVRDLLGRHFDLLSRFGIAAGSRLAVAQAETAESAQLDFLSGAQRFH